MSKALATIVTQPLIVAKVGLQSRPPPARNGKPFKTFGEVMAYIIEHEGVKGLFKGIGPQIMKGVLVQGILMMTKERMEVVFMLLFAYMKTVRERKLRELQSTLKEKALPAAENLATSIKEAVPITVK
jgi:H2-forming N5,N10-methylenetetrahydromethanopterin dehydrogenase-like enzyme